MSAAADRGSVVNPRLIAARALLSMEKQGSWSWQALDRLIEKAKPEGGAQLESRDVALATALVYGVLERRITLDCCIAAHSRTAVDKLEPEVLTALRLGVYQLLYMDGIPDHAAVAQSVELAKNLGKKSAAPLVNAVLRAFLRAEKKIPASGGDLAKRLSAEYSCPDVLVRLWLKSYGEEKTRSILVASLGRPPSYIRVNTLKTTAADLIASLAADGIEAAEDENLSGCLLVSSSGALLKTPQYTQGLFHIQDRSSQLCAAMLGAKAGERVLDACAAPGGKTITIAQHMANSGQIVAADIHENRAVQVQKRATAMGISIVEAMQADMSVHDAGAVFDRILCDVPCSGYGAMRRRPEIKYKNPEEFASLPEIQYKILENTAQYCKDGGTLVYSTCTLNPAENEDVVARFLAAHSDFEAKAMQTISPESGGDGFFIAEMNRRIK